MKSYRVPSGNARRRGADDRDVTGRQFGTRKKIALIGETSYAWICAYYGVMCSSNISVPIDVKLSADEIVSQLDFADVSAVFLSGKLDALRGPMIMQGYYKMPVLTAR